MTDIKPSCSNCRFFSFDECRRRTPAVIQQTAWTFSPPPPGSYAYTQSFSTYATTVWPKVGPHQWCGEHQDRTYDPPQRKRRALGDEVTNGRDGNLDATVPEVP